MFKKSIDVFRKEPLADKSLETYREVAVTYEGSSANATQLRFRYNSSQSVYLPRSYVAVKFKFTKTSGADLISGRYRLSQGAWGIFQRAALSLGGSEIESNADPADTHAILSLSELSSDEIESEASLTRFYPSRYSASDSGTWPHATATFVTENTTTMVGTNPIGEVFEKADTATYDHMYALAGQPHVAGAALFTGSVWAYLKLSDVLGVARLDKVIPRALLELQLDKQTNWNNVIEKTGRDTAEAGNAVADAIVAIEDARLVICEVVPDAREYSNTIEKLRTMSVPMDVLKLDGQVLALGNSSNYSKEIFANGRRIHHLWLVPQLTAVRSQQYFDHLHAGAAITDSAGWTSMNIMCNGQMVPQAQPYMGYNLGYGLEYSDFLKCFQKFDKSGSTWLTLPRWKRMPILYFDLTKINNPQMSCDSTQVIFQATFGAAADRNLIVVYAYESHYEYSPMEQRLHVKS
jgi:alkylated DNA nucleotide flippase Atl1